MATIGQQAVFDADAARFDKAFREADAIRTDEDGWAWIDPERVPADLIRAYQRFTEYGYANGLMP